MLSTMSSTSPGLPTNRVTSPAKRPTPPRIAKPIAPLHSVGHSTCCSRWSTRRYKRADDARRESDDHDEPDDAGLHAEEDPVEQFGILGGAARENIVVRSNLRWRPTTSRTRDYRRLLVFRTELRRFLHWSEEQAEAIGLTAGPAPAPARGPGRRRTSTARRSATSPRPSCSATTAPSASSTGPQSRSRPAGPGPGSTTGASASGSRPPDGASWRSSVIVTQKSWIASRPACCSMPGRRRNDAAVAPAAAGRQRVPAGNPSVA